MLTDDAYELVGMARNRNKAKVLESQGVEMRYANLNNLSSLRGITRDVDAVIHLAALMRFHARWQDLYHHNVEATRAIALDALQQNVRQFIYASSTEAMGPVNVVPADETSPCHPSYDYGRTKLLAEQWLIQQHDEQGLPVVILRPTGVYGPDDTYVTLSTLRAVGLRKLRLLPGDGNRYVHFTYIDDVVEGFVRALTAGLIANGETYILASDDYRTYMETFAIIANLLNVPPPRYGLPSSLVKILVHLIERYHRLRGIEDFVMHTSVVEDMLTDRAYSNVKAKDHLGFHPKYMYPEGMQATVDDLHRSGIL